jgi:hypothetical protein
VCDRSGGLKTKAVNLPNDKPGPIQNTAGAADKSMAGQGEGRVNHGVRRLSSIFSIGLIVFSGV